MKDLSKFKNDEGKPLDKLTHKEWRAYIKNLIRTNDGALARSLVVIHGLQTEEEKIKGKSIEDNELGFCKPDAAILTCIAHKVKNKKELTPREVCIARGKMPKYWKQLMNVSKGLIQLNE